MTKPTLTITPASETSLTTTWNDILAATNYTLERKLTSGGTFAEVTGAVGMAYNVTSYLDSGLSLSTQYCYRVKGYSSLPNNPPAIYSDEKCLFTPLAAPVLADPTVVSTTQIDLSWNNVAGNTGYELQRCYTNYPDNPEYLGYYGNNPANDSWFWTCGAIISLPQDTVSYSNTGLLPGYTYRFKVRDTYPGGTSAYSATKDTITKPTAPTLSATPASTTQMNLSWNNVNGDTGYKLEWKPRSGADCAAGSWSAPITIGQNVTTYQQTTGLTASTYYCYRIKAYNSYTESAYSGEVSQTTQLDPPTLNALSGVTASKIDVNWNQVSGNAGYKVERKTGVLGSWSQVGTVAQNVINFSNSSGLSPGTLYYYRVSVQNAGGYSLPSNEVFATTTPVAPTVTATTVSDDRIDLAWTVKLGATHYKIERKEGAGAYNLIDTVAADYVQKYCGYDYPTVACPSLSDVGVGYQSTGLSGSTNYCYRVTSWNSSGGDSAYSTEKCATTFAIAIQNLSAAAVNSTKIRLDWTPVACIPIACDNPDGFEIERQIRQGIWVKLATVNGSTLTYTDALAIDPNKQYSYRIKTFKGGDKSPYSNTATATTPLYATSPPSCP